jgi:hypothetical protein
MTTRANGRQEKGAWCIHVAHRTPYSAMLAPVPATLGRFRGTLEPTIFHKDLCWALSFPQKMKLPCAVMAICLGLPRVALDAQVPPAPVQRGRVVDPPAKGVVDWPQILPDPTDCSPAMRRQDGDGEIPRAVDAPTSPQAVLRCISASRIFRKCVSFAGSYQEPNPLRADAFVRDSVSWAPVFQYLIRSLLGNMQLAWDDRSRHPWRVVVPYATPEWQRLANVLRVGLRATTPTMNEQDIDQIIVGPLQIVGDSGTMRITRVTALREGLKGRVVKTTRSEYSLQYFVRANCWQLSQSSAK